MGRRRGARTSSDGWLAGGVRYDPGFSLRSCRLELFPFLCLSVIFSALVLIVVGPGGRDERIVAIVLILGEVLLLLQSHGIVDLPFGSTADTRSATCAIITVAAFVQLMRSAEKAFPILAVFAALQQLLVSLKVIGGVTI